MKRVLFSLFCLICTIFASLVTAQASFVESGDVTDKELITRAKEEGLITSIKSFRPNSLITREESAYWIVKILIGDDDGTGYLFKDDKKITKKYRKAVYLSYDNDFLYETNGMIYPKKYLTPTELLSGLECCIEDEETIHNYLLGLKSKRRFVRKIELLKVLNMIYNGEDSDSESFPVPEGLSPEQKQKMLIETQKKLDEAKQLRTKNSLKHYAVKEKMHPYCGGNVACVGDRRRPFSYDVVSGSITSGSAIFIDTTGGLVSLEEYNTFFTVERYFDFIEAQLKSSPIEVSIVYDSIFGYPKQIYIDRADSVDDEIYKDFELISK